MKTYKLKIQLLFIILIIVLVLSLISGCGKNTIAEKDEWHTFDGREIKCRVAGCGKKPVYAEWDDRFCTEHLDKSANHADEYDKSVARKKVNTTPAMTQEQANALIGTGYGGTRPYSQAETWFIEAEMIKCKNCGMHSTNGKNSLCNECQYNKDYGFD